MSEQRQAPEPQPTATPSRPATTSRSASENETIASALRTLALEGEGLKAIESELRTGLHQPFIEAIDRIRETVGRVIVTGIGKSGHVGAKIAATFASTGTAAYFVHPSEASHGDLGMITQRDIVLAISWSGETVELANIIRYTRRFSVPLVAMTARADSALGKAADVLLKLPEISEACPHGLAPTTSTTMQLALGDCLAIALLESRGFTALDFKVFHPGGHLGANLLALRDIMHTGDQLPTTGPATPMADALVTMTERSFGCIAVVEADGRLAGIITDGDLRRNMGEGLLKASASDIMTRNPKVATPDMLAARAIDVINTSGITALFVVEDARPVGIVHIHDLLRLGVA